MTLFNWNDSLLLGFDKIDKQHKNLLEIINHLMDTIVKRKSRIVIGKIIKQLNEYCQEHFENEELFMKTNSYEDLELHKLEHDSFRDNLNHFKKRFQDEGPSEELSIVVQRKLNKWWIDHILKIDKKYADFINEKRSKIKEKNKS